MKFFAKANGKRGEIYIYDAIGGSWDGSGITAKSFQDSLKDIGNVSALDIYVNSPGGSVFEGLAIYNQIKRHAAAEKVVHIDGIAASIASVIAMAGTEIRIAENGMFMIHDPWGMAVGGATEMRKQADALDKIRDVLLDTYVAKTGGSRATISAWMTEETWMTAKESVDRKFATCTTKEKKVKAEFTMLAQFNKVPEQLRKQGDSTEAKLAKMEMGLLKLQK
jgi:ATP-dependent Clp protease protease subunit